MKLIDTYYRIGDASFDKRWPNKGLPMTRELEGYLKALADKNEE